MFEGMFNNVIAMWVYIGMIVFIGVYMSIFFLKESKIVNEIKNKFKRKKESRDVLNFSFSALIFGERYLLFMFITGSIKDWFKKYQYTIIMIIINIIVLTPLGLLISGVINQLPEIFSALYLIYFMFLGLTLMVRSENKRNEYPYQDNYWHPNSNDRNDDKYIYEHKSTSYYKSELKGLPKEEIQKKKKEIRDNLIKNKEIKKKYNL
jgi:hypothetical protein